MGPHLHLEHELVAAYTELRLKQDRELLLRHGLCTTPVSTLDPL